MSKNKPTNKEELAGRRQQRQSQPEMVKVYGLSGRWRGKTMPREQYEAARKVT